jgi:hypothetical protein
MRQDVVVARVKMNYKRDEFANIENLVWLSLPDLKSILMLLHLTIDIPTRETYLSCAQMFFTRLEGISILHRHSPITTGACP